LFYPYVVMCAFLFFFSIHFLVYMRFLFLHLSSAPAQRQLSYSAGPQCQLSTCSELSQAQQWELSRSTAEVHRELCVSSATARQQLQHLDNSSETVQC
jgi:hypothetical protein